MFGIQLFIYHSKLDSSRLKWRTQDSLDSNYSSTVVSWIPSRLERRTQVGIQPPASSRCRLDSNGVTSVDWIPTLQSSSLVLIVWIPTVNIVVSWIPSRLERRTQVGIQPPASSRCRLDSNGVTSCRLDSNIQLDYDVSRCLESN